MAPLRLLLPAAGGKLQGEERVALFIFVNSPGLFNQYYFFLRDLIP